MKKVLTILSLISLTGCASIASGTSQDIAINTNPSGATCTFERVGAQVAELSKTPGIITVKKTKDDIIMTCKKKGYEESTFIIHSGSEGYTAGNLIAGGLIGWGIDSATGADNKYDSPVNLTLNKK